jgi:hypothetical protein
MLGYQKIAGQIREIAMLNGIYEDESIVSQKMLCSDKGRQLYMYANAG